MKIFIVYFLLFLAILSNTQSFAQNNRVVVVPLGSDAPPAEVIFTEKSLSAISFVNELATSASNGLRQTFSTSKSGRLSISMMATIGIGCSPTSSAARYYYLMLDGVPIESSVVIAFDRVRIGYRLNGITESVIPKGEHNITVGGECYGTNSPNPISWLLASNASILVLPH